MALVIMIIVALAWCAWLLYDGIQECRKIDAGSCGRDGARPSRLADCVEVR